MKTIPLDHPIQRGEQTIAMVDLRRPSVADLKGLSLTALMQMEVDVIGKLLPRISAPPLTPAEVRSMDPADLVSCAGEIAGFLTPKRYLEETQETQTPPD